jgi:hypothetical protein
MHVDFPGTIDLGKFRLVYEEERRRLSDGSDGYFSNNAQSFV